MSDFIQLTPDGTSKTLAAGEVGLIAVTGAILDGSVTMANAQLYNFGLVVADDAAVILTASRAYVENHGSLSGAGDTATIDGFTDVTFQVALNLVNEGTITARAFGNAAILTASGANRISNHGTISAFSGIAIDLRDVVAAVAGAGNHLVNTGTIDGTRLGAISIANGTTSDRLVNDGAILGDVTLGSGDVVLNSGSINGALSLGSTGAGVLRNTGEIAGDVTTSGLVVNSGTIAGRLSLGTGADTVRLAGGTVAGGVVDQGGNDAYFVDSGVEISDTSGKDTVTAWADFELGAGIEALVLRGGAVLGAGNELDNTITGSGQANLLDGMDGNDTVFGMGGRDTVYAGGGDDSLNGGLGHDSLDGGGDNDSMDGSHGDDTLVGASGNDTLTGGGSNDVLIGGLGADSMNGGIEADVFVFELLEDSPVAASDIIVGFTTRSDTIDLSRLDANITDAADSAFVRVAAFSGTAGQLILRVVGGNSFLEGDVDGVGGADFSIRLNGVTALAGTDIIL